MSYEDWFIDMYGVGVDPPEDNLSEEESDE